MHSDRVRIIKKGHLQPEGVTQAIAKGLNAKPLRGMVTRGGIDHARLPGEVRGALGDFAADIGIGACLDGRIERILGSPRAPGHTPDGAGQLTHQQGFTIQPAPQAGRKHAGIPGRMARGGDLGHAQQPVPSEGLALRPAETAGQTHVIAKLGMHIKRQVVGDQIDLMGQRHGQTRAARPEDAGVLPSPEPAVVYQHHLRLLSGGLLQHGKTCGDGTEHPNDPGAPSTCKPFGQ